MSEAAEILTDLLISDDFQPAYSTNNFKCGPALRGGIERAYEAVAQLEAANARQSDTIVELSRSNAAFVAENETLLEQQKRDIEIIRLLERAARESKDG